VHRKKPLQIFLFSLITLALATFLGLIIAEFAIRFFAPQSLVSDIIAMDPDLDYRLRPNARGRMTSPEYSAEVRINSLGFRGEEISSEKKPGVYRVLFLGASFVYGNGLGEDETLPFFVGQELNRKKLGNFEAINGGVYGYSTAQDVELFMKYGLPLKPDVVVILVKTEGMVLSTEWTELDSDGRLRRKQKTSQYKDSRRITRFIPGAAWLRERSHLFKFVGMRVLPVLKIGAAQKSEDPSTQKIDQTSPVDELSPEYYRDERGPFRVTVALLSRLASVAQKHGIRTVLLTLGSPRDFEGGKVVPVRMLPHEQLVTASLQVGFTDAIALAPVLATYTGKEDLFFREDRHWTSAATRFVAPAIADTIIRSLN
jgi:SGNH hydrolase-like domain, acetyltransferase AlgX